MRLDSHSWRVLSCLSHAVPTASKSVACHTALTNGLLLYKCLRAAETLLLLTYLRGSNKSKKPAPVLMAQACDLIGLSRLSRKVQGQPG